MDHFEQAASRGVAPTHCEGEPAGRGRGIEDTQQEIDQIVHPQQVAGGQPIAEDPDRQALSHRMGEPGHPALILLSTLSRPVDARTT